MLIISRKKGERIFIGDDVVIEVMQCSYGSSIVKIGIEAPVTVKVLREELKDKQPRKGKRNDSNHTKK